MNAWSSEYYGEIENVDAGPLKNVYSINKDDPMDVKHNLTFTEIYTTAISRGHYKPF